jgi:hypothetical protein
VQTPYFTSEWDRCQVVLAEHEQWYRKIRISRDGAPEIGSDESARIEPLIRVAVNQYISGTAEERETLRTFFSSTDRCHIHLFRVVGLTVKEFEALPSESNFEYALAAMSLENNRLGYRDSYMLLGRLYLTAKRGGIDPDPLLQRIAGISDTRPVYAGQASMQYFLAEFKRSAFFRESVAHTAHPRRNKS